LVPISRRGEQLFDAILLRPSVRAGNIRGWSDQH
jgi:hypothetical protein